MIKVDLLKPLRPNAPLPLLEETEGSPAKKLAVIFAVFLVLAGGAAFYLFQAGYFAEAVARIRPVREEGGAAPRPRAAPKRVTDQAVEEIVREIHDERALAAPLLAYEELFPSEKIEFQNFVSSQVLRRIREAVPGRVGFADFIFTAPGEFYIRGLTYDPASLELFRRKLASMENIEVRTGLIREVGRGAAREFSLYGSVKVPVQVRDGTDRTVRENRLPTTLSSFRSAAAELGINLKTPELRSTTPVGPYQKRVYTTEAVCDYDQLQDLLERMDRDRSSFGLLKFALKANGDETMVASLDLLLYVD